ncbi:unnamed protein product, partial [Mesorhabditis spiculigera]
MKKMKEEYIGVACTVCGAGADGLHYGAVSCRSCNAFFRRAVSYKQYNTYECRYIGKCDVTVEGRCSCRACRFQKCIEAGMRIESVQPRRDPTGSQKDRKRRMGSEEEDSSPEMQFKIEPADSPTEQKYEPYVMSPPPPINNASNGIVKFANDGPMDLLQGKPFFERFNENRYKNAGSIREQLTEDDLFDEAQMDPSEVFERLLICYREHVEHMRLNMLSAEEFLKPKQRRAMVPDDVENLSKAELAGLMYWLNKMTPYPLLPEPDRQALMKRFSVRKLSLDHFYYASQHKTELVPRNFCMLNNTFVPDGRTGFELKTDDEKQVKAKQQIFRPTYDRMWRTVIIPFNNMEIIDAEVVFLHGQLLWSPLNSIHVESHTRKVLQERREWFTNRLHEYYRNRGLDEVDAGLRLGNMFMMLSEIETICNQHCHDFQVCKLFEFCDMSQFWYEKICYTPVNTMAVSHQQELRDEANRADQQALKDRLIQMHEEKRRKDEEMRIRASIPLPTIEDRTYTHKLIETLVSVEEDSEEGFGFGPETCFISPPTPMQMLNPPPKEGEPARKRSRKTTAENEKTMPSLQTANLLKTVPVHHQTFTEKKYEPTEYNYSFDRPRIVESQGSLSPPDLQMEYKMKDYFSKDSKIKIAGPGFIKMDQSQRMNDIKALIYNPDGDQMDKLDKKRSHSVELPSSSDTSPESIDIRTPPPWIL